MVSDHEAKSAFENLNEVLISLRLELVETFSDIVLPNEGQILGYSLDESGIETGFYMLNEEDTYVFILKDDEARIEKLNAEDYARLTPLL